MTKWLARLSALGVAFLLLVQGQAALAQDPSAGKKIVRIGSIQSVDSMNPFKAVRLIAGQLQRWTYLFLTTPDPKTLAPSPDLAESWTTSPDGLTWTFKIRETKWSDGKPVTAHDAAWTFNKIMTDDKAKTGNGPAVENFESVSATDDRTLVIKTKAPQASMLENPIPIVPKHVWEKVADIDAYEAEDNPAVNGAYIPYEQKKDQYVKLKANPDYWRGKAKIDELQVVFYENPEAAVAGLKKGDIDLIGRLAAPQWEAGAGDANIVQWNTPGRRAAYLQINHGATTSDDKPIGDGHPALKDVKVRQALHYAIDKKALVDQVQNGLAVPAEGSIVPPMYKDFFWQAEGADKVSFDLAKANQILDEAGYKKGADGVRTMPDDPNKKLEFRFSIHTETPTEEKLAQFLTGWFKEIGITLTTRALDSNKFTEETGSTALFDIAISGWSVNPDPEEVLATHLCSRRPTPSGEGGGTESFWCNQEYEGLYTNQLKELDRAKRADLIKQMQKNLYVNAPVIAIYYPNNLELYRKDRITSIEPVPAGRQGEGILYGGSSGWPMYSMDAPAPAGAASGGGMSTGLIAGIVGGVVAVAAVGFLALRRRKTTADDRE
ncbi:ABC transporter substrate-binding protein [Nonomuraea sp. NPDC050310]|uniref:ABC transporter substrate-binding protein n=1 Tax=unclassified Nonomuraea TaxID=2593643 RepID=UPI0033D7E8C4